jgi:hypothetical protein
MKHATDEDSIASFPYQFFLQFRGGDYQTIHAIRKLLQANAWDIGTHFGGGALGHLGMIVSVAAYAIVAPTHPWANPAAPGRGPEEIAAGTAAQLAMARHLWEENGNTFCMYCTVEQALNKQIITVFQPMYLDILNDDMVGVANTSSRDMLDQLCLTYESITYVDLEHNFENMRKAWDPQKPVETLFKQIQDCVNLAEAGGITIGPAQHISVVYAFFFCNSKFHESLPQME